MDLKRGKIPTKPTSLPIQSICDPLFVEPGKSRLNRARQGPSVDRKNSFCVFVQNLPLNGWGQNLKHLTHGSEMPSIVTKRPSAAVFPIRPENKTLWIFFNHLAPVREKFEIKVVHGMKILEPGDQASGMQELDIGKKVCATQKKIF